MQIKWAYIHLNLNVRMKFLSFYSFSKINLKFFQYFLLSTYSWKILFLNALFKKEILVPTPIFLSWFFANLLSLEFF